MSRFEEYFSGMTWDNLQGELAEVRFASLDAGRVPGLVSGLIDRYFSLEELAELMAADTDQGGLDVHLAPFDSGERMAVTVEGHRVGVIHAADLEPEESGHAPFSC